VLRGTFFVVCSNRFTMTGIFVGSIMYVWKINMFIVKIGYLKTICKFNKHKEN